MSCLEGLPLDEKRQLAREAVAATGRLAPRQGEALFWADLMELGRAADRKRRELHPEGYVTFIRDRIINYTNVCVTYCRFCAFYRPPGHEEAYVRPKDEIFRKVEEMLQHGGTTVMLQGGHNPELRIEYYEDLFSSIKARFPTVYLHSMTASEIDHVAGVSGLTLEETLRRLRQAGLDSLPGGGAEMLVDDVREKVAPLKISADRWFEVHETAHRLGMESTATMVFGFGEEHHHRIEHLERLRQLQDRTGGFRSFIHWSLTPGNSGMQRTIPPGGIEYLRILAIARLYLDNFPHIHSGWVTEGAKLAQLALNFGADDLGSVLMEELVISATGVAYAYTSEQLVRLIREAGRIPAVRNSCYEVLEVCA
ncbi:MAG: dehypoxanthine futalosine cyclase [Armatimonadetes bacterium]|nr:dehypoxanthine futalosine cyclase [Armatimonadota bacterium]